MHSNRSALHICCHARAQVVLAINDRGRDHIPYRSSKLTHVLKDSLGGNCRTVLVANIWGTAGQLEESLSTCRCGALPAGTAEQGHETPVRDLLSASCVRAP
jgi:hypothetical protein